jgi:hypothetical protein
MFGRSPLIGGKNVTNIRNAPETRNVTEHEPNIPNNTVPLATHLKLKGQLREYRKRCAAAEARVQALQTTLEELLQVMKHGEGRK